jgi:hypothetical protein
VGFDASLGVRSSRGCSQPFQLGKNKGKKAGDRTIPTLALELPARILMRRQGASGFNLCRHSRIVETESRGCSGRRALTQTAPRLH